MKFSGSRSLSPLRLAVLGLATISSLAHAATIQSNQAVRAEWQVGTSWSDGEGAQAGNDYIINSGHQIYSPLVESATSIEFPGDSLTVQGGRITSVSALPGVGLKQMPVTYSDLRLENGSAMEFFGNSGGNNFSVTPDSTIDLTGAVRFVVVSPSTAGQVSVEFNAPLTGDGSLSIERTQTQGSNTNRFYVFNGDLSGYSGNVTVAASTSGRTNQVTFNSGSNGWGTGNLTVSTFANVAFGSGLSVIAPAQTVSIAANTSFDLGDQNSVFGTFNIAGSPVDPGTYTATGLTALGMGGTFSGSGSITVIPEASSAFLIGASALLFSLRRRRSC